MKRNIVIAIQATVIVILGTLLISRFRQSHIREQQGSPQSFQWPEAPLVGGERIFGVRVEFKQTYITGIKNIPPGWHLEVSETETPNPTFEGSIIVGVAALSSIKNLPQFDIQREDNSKEPAVTEVEYTLTDYRNGEETERKVVLPVNTP